MSRGLLVRCHREVFAVGHGVLRAEGHYLAAVLACGDDAALSHRSAGAVLGVRKAASSFIEVTAPGFTGRSRKGIRVHGCELAADEVFTHNGIPCTTLSRTILDLAAVLPVRGIGAVVETAERLEMFDLRSLSILLGRHRGKRGTAKLRRVLAAFNAEVLRARTESEARFFHLCVDHEIAPPLVNRFVEAGGERFEVDCHWPQARVIVEVDSPFHDTTAARIRDARRDAALARDGWTVLRCRWVDITEHPEPLLATLRRALAAANCV